MKKLTVTALVLTAFGVAACGGSGGGKAPSVQSSNTVGKPAVQASTESASSTAAKPSTANASSTGTAASTAVAGNSKDPIQGNILVLNEQNKIAAASKPAEKTDSKEVLVVNGKKVALVLPMVSSGGFTRVEERVSFNGLETVRYISGSLQGSYMKFGYIHNLNQDKTPPVVFAQGVISQDVPTTGTASYQGEAVLVSGQNRSRGDSQFTVDFAKKTLEGRIDGSVANTPSIHLAAKIEGSHFSGVKDGYTTNGAFYGPQAAELAGVYRSNDGAVSGAYGAIKQK